MKSTEPAPTATGGMKAALIDRLHHPLQLRIFVAAVVMLVGYAPV